MIHYIYGNQLTEEIVKNSNKLMVVNFYALWSMPCEEQSTIIDNIDKIYDEEVEFYKVDIDENKDVTIRYSINTTPTILFFKEEKEIERCNGLTTENGIMQIIDELK